jgi:hypothetical protein
MIHYNKFSITKLQWKLPCSEKPSRNSCHESNTTKPNLPPHFINPDFCITFKSVCSSVFSTMTRIYTARSGVQILAEARELSSPQYSDQLQRPLSLQLNENHSFFSAGKVASAI